MSDMRKIIIDKTELEVDPAMTLIQAAELADIEIPRFCYHERLTIAGNCRMCLVEVVGGPSKPVASCAMQVRDLRPSPDGSPPVIKTNSPMVKKAREGVMEFLLINHPLDCPICDQGGECDLQDQAMSYGAELSRYNEPKRATQDLDLGPLVGTQMTRCISCTRCVRFTTEVAGITQMGQTGRGEDAEITAYLNETLDSELQGNIIDLCPVGALTSKPYAFTARPWELTKTQTIDVMDALGSNIRVDTKGRDVMRILPRNHDGINEEWLADKSRFIWDGLARQRLDQPYVRVGGKLQPASWNDAFAAIVRATKGRKVLALAGDLMPVEPLYAVKKLMQAMGGAVECRTDGAFLPIGNRAGYVGTAQVSDIDTAQFIQLIGTNPRVESPVLNARIRKAYLAGARIGLVGARADLTYDYAYVGDNRAALQGIATMDISESTQAARSIVIIGQGALQGSDGQSVLALAQKLAENTKSKLLILHTAAGRVGAMDIGFANEGGLVSSIKEADVIYNLGADELNLPDKKFVIYQGSHGDRGAHRADVILPSACYTEESGIFVNTEGRAQMAARAVFPPKEARENWAIVRELSAHLGATLPFDSLDALRSDLFAEYPHLGELDAVPYNKGGSVKMGKIKDAPFKNAFRDHYLTNPIARASALMAELSQGASLRKTAKGGA